MSSAVITENKLLVTIKASGAKWNEDLDVARSLNDRLFISATRVWEAPATQENISILFDAGFDLCEKALQALSAPPQEEKPYEERVAKRFVKNPIVAKELFAVQNSHAQRLVYDLETNGAALDASDTGTGKTYSALGIARYMGLFPIVITPKSVIPGWKSVAKKFGIDCYVNNYEQYKGNHSSYVTVNNSGSRISFKWNLPEKALVIFDEVHRCKNPSTINAKMLTSLIKQDVKVLGLSATIAENPVQMYAIGTILRLFNSYPGYWRWAKERGVFKGYWGMEFTSTKENMIKIHNDIFPEKGSRLRTTDFGDLFPETRIISEPIGMDNSEKIQQAYERMDAEIGRLHDKMKEDTSATLLTRILRERQRIELLKVPSIVEMAEDLVEEGNSVAIFVNFKETVDALSTRLKTTCIIDGRVKDEAREMNRADFQEDRQRIIICNTAAGGVGISLHDIRGEFPRFSLISPTYSAVDFIQVLGRLPRANAKSKVVQRILFCAGTKEEEVAARVAKKVENIEAVNNGDLA